MTKRSILLLLPILITSALLVIPTYSQPDMVNVIVLFKDKPMADLVNAHGGQIRYQYHLIQGIAASIPQKAVQALSQNPNVIDVEPDTVMKLPDDWQVSGRPSKPPKLYTLTISISGAGTTDPLAGTYSHTSGTKVKIYAYPETGWILEKWTVNGDDRAPNSPITVVMKSDTTVMATFVEETSPPEPPPPTGQTVEWGVDRIDAELAWQSSNGSAIWVAVLDTGIDRDHPDLADNVKGGSNFVGGLLPWIPPDPRLWDDDNGHGTWCAGIIGAVDNDIGVIGTAPKVYLYGVKVLNSQGQGLTSDIIAGIQWCVDNRMKVMSMSFGGTAYSLSLEQAVDNAYAAGVVIVAASGNSGDGDSSTDNVNYPAKYYGAIAISGIDRYDNVPTWSSDGQDVELCAPAVDIRSTALGGGYEIHSGTSGACPHVAGVVALALSTNITTHETVYPGLDSDSDGIWSPFEVRQWLNHTADDLGEPGWDRFYGSGLVDAQEAVTNSQGP